MVLQTGRPGEPGLDELGEIARRVATAVETVISGPALERHYRQRTGRRAPLPEIVRRAGC